MGSDGVTGLLLDTHAWLWLVAADPALKASTREEVEAAAAASSLYLSPISMWEVALKHSRGKLALDRPVRDWLTYAANLPGLQLAAITPAIAAECAALPQAFHGDPADRLIAATARTEGLRLITHDDALLKLADRGLFQAIAT